MIDGILFRDGYSGKPVMLTEYTNPTEPVLGHADNKYDYEHDCHFVYCPYCNYCDEEPYFSTRDMFFEEEEFECSSCSREFTVDADFGSGYTANTKRCREGAHKYYFERQGSNHSMDKMGWHKVLTCTNCDYSKYTWSPKDTKTREFLEVTTPLPWREEYNNPDYFDPEGTLKASKTYGACTQCNYQGVLNKQSTDEDGNGGYYDCPECHEEAEPKNILDLPFLKTPILDGVEIMAMQRDWKNKYGYERKFTLEECRRWR
ncbi:MAG: hypothetical protein COA47_10015 [Robiginitomaculum sp.]|nr:MAG: hypothetical protein COA47_10015 [Robiginitomaculum sp.]